MVLLLQLFDCEIRKCGGWDQAVFTRLVYTELGRRAPLVVRTTELGYVANLHASLEVRVGSTHEVINENGDPYAVVHAYDRFARLTAIVSSRFPYRGDTGGGRTGAPRDSKQSVLDVFSHA
eukprot:5382811-Prymnesium_polylepis.1